jgi:hypothetical protein
MPAEIDNHANEKKDIEQFCFFLLTRKNAEGKPKAGFGLGYPVSESSKYV